MKTLPDGFETRIGDGKSNQLASSILQRLNLARCYLKDAPIVILDEPGNALDFDADQTMMDAINHMQGRKTVIMITHRPSHMRLADKVISLERVERIERHGSINARSHSGATEGGTR